MFEMINMILYKLLDHKTDKKADQKQLKHHQSRMIEMQEKIHSLTKTTNSNLFDEQNQ